MKLLRRGVCPGLRVLSRGLGEALAGIMFTTQSTEPRVLEGAPRAVPTWVRSRLRPAAQTLQQSARWREAPLCSPRSELRLCWGWGLGGQMDMLSDLSSVPAPCSCPRLQHRRHAQRPVPVTLCVSVDACPSARAQEGIYPKCSNAYSLCFSTLPMSLSYDSLRLNKGDQVITESSSYKHKSFPVSVKNIYEYELYS